MHIRVALQVILVTIFGLLFVSGHAEGAGFPSTPLQVCSQSWQRLDEIKDRRGSQQLEEEAGQFGAGLGECL